MARNYSGYFEPIYYMTDQEYLSHISYARINTIVDEYANACYNENLQSVLGEEPEDLEFGGYNPLCDTAVYYFIEDYFEFDEPDEGEESLELYNSDDDDDEEEDEDYDVLDAEGLDFWLHCFNIGIKLKPIDCLMED